MCKFGIFFDDETPANTLLYFYSNYKKDEADHRNKQKNKSQMRGVQFLTQPSSFRRGGAR